MNRISQVLNLKRIEIIVSEKRFLQINALVCPKPVVVDMNLTGVFLSNLPNVQLDIVKYYEEEF